MDKCSKNKTVVSIVIASAITIAWYLVAYGIGYVGGHSLAKLIRKDKQQ